MTDKDLFNYLAMYGGKIVSTNSLSPEWIEQARASNRLYVDEHSLGYVWEPDIKRLPETDEEVEWFEKWYPLKVQLPDDLKDFDKWMERRKQRELEQKQTKEN